MEKRTGLRYRTGQYDPPNHYHSKNYKKLNLRLREVLWGPTEINQVMLRPIERTLKFYLNWAPFPKSIRFLEWFAGGGRGLLLRRTSDFIEKIFYCIPAIHQYL